MKINLPKNEVQSVEEEWYRLKVGFKAEKVCGKERGRRRYKETPWWTDSIKETVRRKYQAWGEWFNNRTDNKKENLKRLDKAAKCTIKFEKKGHEKNM
jgi:hypothetical protein